MTVAADVERAITAVLVVEDRAREAGPVRALFQSGAIDGFELDVATGIAAASARFADRAYDVVLYVTARLTERAIEATRRLHEAAPGTPVVVLTAFHDAQQARRVLREGAQDVLVHCGLSCDLLLRALHHAAERQAAAVELARITRDLREANERLEALTILDPLTGLLNRRGFERQLEHEALWLSRGEDELLAVMIDLDDFKSVNDTLGHATGDRVLAEVTARLRANLRATDAVARIGGDEFIVLLPRTRLAEGRGVAEKLRLALSGVPVELGDGRAVPVTASLAVVPIEDAALSLDALLADTHEALYRSKRQGKNRVSEGGDEARAIRALVRGEGLHVVRQPVMHLASDTPIGFEFLARTEHPGFERPEDFFRLAREAGVLAAVDLQCVRAALAASASLEAGQRCFVNLLPATLAEIPIGQLLELFPRGALDRGYCVELSEQQFVGDPSYVEPAVAALKRAGLLVAIDDVGFGRKTLVVLEPDVVKLDRRVVTGLANDPPLARKLARLARLVETAGAIVIAEGVESRADADALVSLGIAHGQGFYFAAPC